MDGISVYEVGIAPARRTAIVALALYAAFIVYQSVADGGAWLCAGPVLSTHARLSRTDLLANVVAYAPLGLLLGLALAGDGASRWHRLAARLVAGVLLVTALSAGLEVLQACQSARVSSAYDWAANSFGGVAGLVIGVLVPSMARSEIARRMRWWPADALAIATVGIAAGWVLSQTSPWVFSVDVGTVRSNLSFLRHWSVGPPLDVWHVVRHAGAWLTIACAWRLVARGPWHAAGGLAITAGLSLLLQTLLEAHRPLTLEELVGMAATAVIALPALAHAGDRPRLDRWAIGMMCGAALVVGAYELRPDPLATSSAQVFSGWPRVGLGGLSGALDYALLFGWFGAATVTAAQWAQDAGRRQAWTWPVLAIVATSVLEILQMRIPGRGPDMSAPVFTLLAVFATRAWLRADRRR